MWPVHHTSPRDVASPPYLHPVGAAVHVVAQEEEAGRRQQRTQTPQGLLEADQVLEVAVDVSYRAADGQGGEGRETGGGEARGHCTTV